MRQPQLICDRCSFEERLYSFFPYYCLYELPDGGHVPIPIRTEWCYQCKNLCVAENLPDIASTSKEVQEAKGALLCCLERLSPNSAERIAGYKLWAPHRLEPAERMHFIVSNRKSPPRCLSCGSFDHKELLLSGYPEGKRTTLQIQHPGCGGNFITDDRILIWADFVCPKRYYTPEGIFLRLDSPFEC
jgi:hypothetical protein